MIIFVTLDFTLLKIFKGFYRTCCKSDTSVLPLDEVKFIFLLIILQNNKPIIKELYNDKYTEMSKTQIASYEIRLNETYAMIIGAIDDGRQV